MTLAEITAVAAEAALDPRVARSRAALLEAAVALILERGFRECTIDAIVERTRIARTTLYRHWPSRAALLEQAIDRISQSRPLPDTGSLRGDLLELFITRAPSAAVSRSETEPGPAPIRFEQSQVDPGSERLQAKIMERVQHSFRTLIERARDRGEVRKDLGMDAMVNMLMSAVIGSQRNRQNVPPTIAYVVDVIDILTRGARP